jgi:hypothetical protein
MLTTIEEAWIANNKQVNFKVRYRDWNYRIKFFEIEGYSQDGQRLVGKLDTGEVISYLSDPLYSVDSFLTVLRV